MSTKVRERRYGHGRKGNGVHWKWSWPSSHQFYASTVPYFLKRIASVPAAAAWGSSDMCHPNVDLRKRNCKKVQVWGNSSGLTFPVSKNWCSDIYWGSEEPTKSARQSRDGEAVTCVQKLESAYQRSTRIFGSDKILWWEFLWDWGLGCFSWGELEVERLLTCDVP